MGAAYSLLVGKARQFSTAILAASQGLEDHHDDSHGIWNKLEEICYFARRQQNMASSIGFAVDFF